MTTADCECAHVVRARAALRCRSALAWRHARTPQMNSRHDLSRNTHPRAARCPHPNADPYNETAYPDADPPIPGNPCRFDASKVVAGSAGGAFTNYTGGAPSEDQLVAFVHHNGPTQTGIDADVFGLRAKGCEATGDCWITADDCKKVANKPIDHSILLVGYGTDPVRGDYWLVKNSWSTAFANGGFIFVQRGVNCGQIACCGNTFTYGDPAAYYE